MFVTKRKEKQHAALRTGVQQRGNTLCGATGCARQETCTGASEKVY